MQDRTANPADQEEASNLHIDPNDNIEEPFNADFWFKVMVAQSIIISVVSFDSVLSAVS